MPLGLKRLPPSSFILKVFLNAWQTRKKRPCFLSLAYSRLLRTSFYTCTYCGYWEQSEWINYTKAGLILVPFTFIIIIHTKGGKERVIKWAYLAFKIEEISEAGLSMFSWIIFCISDSASLLEPVIINTNQNCQKVNFK